jgi:DNA-binding transcriptional ArsR family regulator
MEAAARGFSAMGSEARLGVLMALVRAGEAGLTVSEVQARTGIAPSTLAHHLKFLAAGGVISQERVGRATINRAAIDHIAALSEFIVAQCCADQTQRAANDG